MLTKWLRSPIEFWSKSNQSLWWRHPCEVYNMLKMWPHAMSDGCLYSRMVTEWKWLKTPWYGWFKSLRKLFAFWYETCVRHEDKTQVRIVIFSATKKVFSHFLKVKCTLVAKEDEIINEEWYSSVTHLLPDTNFWIIHLYQHTAALKRFAQIYLAKLGTFQLGNHLHSFVLDPKWYICFQSTKEKKIWGFKRISTEQYRYISPGRVKNMLPWVWKHVGIMYIFPEELLQRRQMFAISTVLYKSYGCSLDTARRNFVFLF